MSYIIRTADFAEEGPVASVKETVSHPNCLVEWPLRTVEHTGLHAINLNIFALGLVPLGNDRRDGAAILPCERDSHEVSTELQRLGISYVLYRRWNGFNSA